MSRLLVDQQEALFTLLCKLEGLTTLTRKEDFYAYRKTIFEAISLLSSIVTSCQD
jgi:hypothetical protein